jgi:hypothetical protein
LTNSLEERAWDQAKRNANAVYTSASFVLGSSCLLVVIAALFAYFSWGQEPGRIALGSMATGIGTALFCFGAVLGFQVVVTPFRQRDELRRLVRGSDRVGRSEIVARASGFARQGDDLLHACKASGTYTRQQADEVEQWTTAVTAFLSPLEGPWAVEFNRASRGQGAIAAKLEGRVEILDSMVEEMGSEDEPAVPPPRASA